MRLPALLFGMLAVGCLQASPVPDGTFELISPSASVSGRVLKDMRSSPEPFQRGGVFIQFRATRKIEALSFRVLDQKGRLRFRSDEAAFGVGVHEFFYYGGGTDHKIMAPGIYRYELKAKVAGSWETLSNSFTKVKNHR